MYKEFTSSRKGAEGDQKPEKTQTHSGGKLSPEKTHGDSPDILVPEEGAVTLTQTTHCQDDRRDSRPESGVFLSTEVSMDPSGARLIPTPRQPLDSGYLTSSISESSTQAGSSVDPTIMEDDLMQPAHFYMTQDSIEDESSALYHESPGPYDESDEEFCESGASIETMTSASLPGSRPVAIPCAASHHAVHVDALGAMDATPPRAYSRYSTGCLTQSPHMAAVLSQKRELGNTQTADLLEREIRVTSGRLHISHSRGALHRERTISESQILDDDAPGRPRDRSLSAPNLGMRRRVLERQCAAELRKMGDEFFNDFPRVKTRVSRDQSDAMTPSRSFPGTQGTRQWWWQTIIQNVSPTRRHSFTTKQPVTSSIPEDPRDESR